MAGFWKPGTSAPGGVERGDDSAHVVDGKLAHLPLNAQRKALPIYRHRNSVLFALEKHRTVVIVGETGCGKTTQVNWIKSTLAPFGSSCVVYIELLSLRATFGSPHLSV